MPLSRAALLLTLGNFLVGMALFAITSTLTGKQLPQLGVVQGAQAAANGQPEDVSRFLPMLLGSAVTFPFLLVVRGRFAVTRWVTVAGVPLSVAAIALNPINVKPLGLQAWALPAVVVLCVSVIQVTRSLRTNAAGALGALGDRYLVWAELGYGLGTAAGILTWSSLSQNLESLAYSFCRRTGVGHDGTFPDALAFSALMLLGAWVIDCVVVSSTRPDSATGSNPSDAGDTRSYEVGDEDTLVRVPAVRAMFRWALVVPLVTMAVQAAVMRQTDRGKFQDFFSYMAFDIGTVVAGVLLSRATVRFTRTPFTPHDYLPVGQPRRYGVVPWLLCCLVAMLAAYGFEAAGMRVGECVSYGVAGFFFEALWAVLFGWLSAAEKVSLLRVRGAVSVTIGSAIIAATVAYVALSCLPVVHPICVTVSAMALAVALVLPRRGRHLGQPT